MAAGGAPAKSFLVGIALVSALVGLWILGSPSGAGPDEPSHLVRSAGLVRGQVSGEPFDELPASRLYEVPAWIAAENPQCYAHDQLEPASCIVGVDVPDGEAELPSRSREYPIWGHLLPGAATFLPASAGPWMARVLHGLIPALLVGVALTERAQRGWLAAGSTLLAITPMAWFLFAVVNPSGLVIAGGLGLWVGLLSAGTDYRSRHGWLIAASWAAMSLPRRDGMIWAVAVVSIVILMTETRLLGWWQRVGRGPQIVIAASTIATMWWAWRSDTTGAKALLLAPALPFLADWLGLAWRNRRRIAPALQVLVAGIGLVVIAIGTLVIMDRRPGGFDATILQAIIGQTGVYMEHLVGVLGWLDTPVPMTAVLVWFIGLGFVAAPAIEHLRGRLLFGAAATIAFALWAAWTLSMVVSDENGSYWQGRYFLPLLAGVPILLGSARTTGAGTSRLGRSAALIALGVNVAAYGAAMRRWAVGVEGTFFPWRWDTYGSPLPPVALLMLFVAVSWAMWRWVSKLCDVEEPASDPAMLST